MLNKHNVLHKTLYTLHKNAQKQRAGPVLGVRQGRTNGVFHPYSTSLWKISATPSWSQSASLT